MRTAIVLDWMANYAGAERAVEEMLTCYPESQVYALVDVLTEENRRFLRGRSVHTSFLQHMPFVRKHFRHYLPLMPLAIRAFHESAYVYYATHVAPAPLSPRRILARALLTTRCWLQLVAAGFR